MGRCDVCQKIDGFRGMNMQTCKSCGVCVHEECYGLENSHEKKKYSKWECHACKLVGRSLDTGRTKDGDKKYVKVTSRPTRCVLCSVKTGIHAMHLLYTDHGQDGRPLVIRNRKDNTEEIAWVHTLCASFINAFAQTKSLVYGCYEDGSYEENSHVSNEIDDDEEDDHDRIKLDYREDGGNKDALIVYPHHYVIVQKEDGEENNWTLRLNEMRNSKLKCFGCGHTDERSLRIPIQCSYDEKCCVAFHVGCARWEGSGKDNKKIVFRPISENDGTAFPETTKAFCEVHAQQRMKERKNDNLLNEMDQDWDEAAETNATVSRGAFGNTRGISGKAQGLARADDGSNQFISHVSKMHKQRRFGKMPSSKYGNSVRDRLMARPSRPRESLYNINLGHRGNQIQFMIDDANKIMDRSETKAAAKEGIDNMKNRWKKREGMTKEEFKDNWKKVKAAILPRTQSFKDKKPKDSNSTDKDDKWKNAWVPNYIHGALDLKKMDEEKIISKEEMEADF